jgi:hypothetical protein
MWLLLAVAQARTLQVGAGGYADLAAAVDASDPGDTIVVAPGNWDLSEVVIDHDLTINAAGASFDGDPLLYALTVSSGATVQVNGGEHLAPILALGELRVVGAVFSLYGTIYADNGATVDLEDCGFIGLNRDGWGTALSVFNADTTITNSVFSDNSGTGSGAIYADGGTLDIVGSTFVDNQCTDSDCSGGAISTLRTELSIRDTEFLNNESDGGAGAIAAVYAPSLEVIDSVFTGNEAQDYGAIRVSSVSVDDSPVLISGSTFTDNQCSFTTGGVQIYGASRVDVVDTTFSGHNGSYGAALWVWSSGDVTLDGVDVVGDDFSAVAMRLEDVGDVSVTDTSFSAFKTGLQILGAGDVSFADNLFADGDTRGAEIESFDAFSSVRDRFCRIGYVLDGAGVFLADGDEATITNGLFDLVDGYDGGGVYIGDVDSATIRFTDFLATAGVHGAAVYATDTSLVFHDNLVAHSQDGAAFWPDGASVDLRGDAWFNNADGDVGGDLTVLVGTGHVTADPQLINWTAGGCVVPGRQPGSPLIGAASAGEDLDGSDADIGATGGPDADPDLWEDGDGDGTVANADCDDADDDRYPGNAESCDDVDEDCDGVVDGPTPPGASTWYRDNDRDGHGDASRSDVACDADDLSGNWVASSDDCAPGDGGTYPGATETCDGDDNDCDGAVDEGVVDGPPRYLDVDGDGFGVGDDVIPSCAPIAGRADETGDCDDGDDAVHPGVEEVCDGVDNDCDGRVDVGATDVVRWYADGDGDGYGDGAAVRACDAPAGHVAERGDCDDAAPDVHPGALEVCGAGAVDANCDGASGDVDGDADGSPACLDCDDADGAVRPGAVEIWYDGVDQDCSGTSDFDADQDGTLAPPWGDDCDDADRDVEPGAEEIPDDGEDQDCDGEDLESEETDETDPGEEITDPPEPTGEDTDDDLKVTRGGACDGTGAAGGAGGLWFALAMVGIRRRNRR